MVTILRRLSGPAVVALLAALAGIAFARSYAPGPLPILLVGAAVVPVLFGMLLRLLHSWVAALLSIVALLGYVLAVTAFILPADPEVSVLRACLDAAVNALPRLVTSSVPIDANPDTVLVPIVLVWLAAFLGATFADRDGRLLLAILPPTVVYVAALVLAGPQFPPLLWQSLAYVAVCAVGLALSAQGRKSIRAVCALVLLIAVLGVLIFPLMPTASWDVRQAVTPPREDVLDINPLARISGWAANPEQHLLDADLSADRPIRLAVLSEYDGVTWRMGTHYRTVGRVLPGRTEAVDNTEVVRQTYTITGLEGGLVPAVDTPTAVDELRVTFDSDTATLYGREKLAPGWTYRVESLSRRPDINLLPIADVPSGPAVARYLEISAVPPPELVAMAEHVAQDNPGAYAKAHALQAFLAEHFRFDPTAPSGHALPNLRFFLNATVDEGGRRGTSEQFAAAYAVLGRLMGLPTRVVVGFRGRAGHHPVLAGDARAWPEVLFTGVGWVPFDPMPHNEDVRPLEEDYTPPPPKTPQATPHSVTSSPPPTEAPQAAVEPPRSAAARRVPPLVLVVVAAVIPLSLAVVVVLRRVRSSRRLRASDPGARVMGAWLEIRDLLRLAGKPAASHMTVRDIALLAAHSYREAADNGESPPSIDRLVRAVNAAGFAPGMVTDLDAGLAVEEAVRYVRALRRQYPWWRRLLWTLSPRPLLWRA